MAENFFNSVQAVADDRSLPPVHMWNPEYCGDIDIRIDAQGSWFHEGSQIKRQKLVDLFSSVLKKEGEEYFLVTPVEKCRIQVDVAPLLVIEWDATGEGTLDQCVRFKTQQGHWFELDQAHAISLRKNEEQEFPIVHVRDGLSALVTRNVYYQLAERIDSAQNLGAENLAFYFNGQKTACDPKQLGVVSHSTFFALV